MGTIPVVGSVTMFPLIPLLIKEAIVEDSQDEFEVDVIALGFH